MTSTLKRGKKLDKKTSVFESLNGGQSTIVSAQCVTLSFLFTCFIILFIRIPAAGFYNKDDIPDFFVRYNTGTGFPVYFYSNVSLFALVKKHLGKKTQNVQLPNLFLCFNKHSLIPFFLFFHKQQSLTNNHPIDPFEFKAVIMFGCLLILLFFNTTTPQLRSIGWAVRLVESKCQLNKGNMGS